MREPLSPFSEVVDERRRWTNDWYSWITELFKSAPLSSVTVGSLPAAGTRGRRGLVTDSNSNVFYTVVATGGTFVVPVYDDGTNWRIG